MWLGAEFLFQVWLRGAAGAVEISAVTALSHEALDNAMKRHAIIEALVREFADALNMVRREVRTELDFHRAGLEFERQGMKGIIDHQLLSLFGLRGTRAGISTSQTEKSARRARRVSSIKSRNCGPSVRRM